MLGHLVSNLPPAESGNGDFFAWLRRLVTGLFRR